MEDQLVSFKTAKLAKELGFKGEVNYKYICRSREHESDDYKGEIVEVKKSLQCDILAPTQSLVQKWLREKHGITIEVRFLNGEYWIVIKDYIYKEVTPTTPRIEHGVYRTYEEALEYGLQESIKLITNTNT